MVDSLRNHHDHIHETLANMLTEQWNQLSADLTNAPEVWNPNEAMTDKTAVFRDRKADLWYTVEELRIERQYFQGVKSMVKKIYQNMVKDSELHIFKTGIRSSEI